MVVMFLCFVKLPLAITWFIWSNFSSIIKVNEWFNLGGQRYEPVTYQCDQKICTSNHFLNLSLFRWKC